MLTSPYPSSDSLRSRRRACLEGLRARDLSIRYINTGVHLAHPVLLRGYTPGLAAEQLRDTDTVLASGPLQTEMPTAIVAPSEGVPPASAPPEDAQLDHSASSLDPVDVAPAFEAPRLPPDTATDAPPQPEPPAPTWGSDLMSAAAKSVDVMMTVTVSDRHTHPSEAKKKLGRKKATVRARSRTPPAARRTIPSPHVTLPPPRRLFSRLPSRRTCPDIKAPRALMSIGAHRPIGTYRHAHHRPLCPPSLVHVTPPGVQALLAVPMAAPEAGREVSRGPAPFAPAKGRQIAGPAPVPAAAVPLCTPLHCGQRVPSLYTPCLPRDCEFPCASVFRSASTPDGGGAVRGAGT